MWYSKKSHYNYFETYFTFAVFKFAESMWFAVYFWRNFNLADPSSDYIHNRMQITEHSTAVYTAKPICCKLPLTSDLDLEYT